MVKVGGGGRGHGGRQAALRTPREGKWGARCRSDDGAHRGHRHTPTLPPHHRIGPWRLRWVIDTSECELPHGFVRRLSFANGTFPSDWRVGKNALRFTFPSLSLSKHAWALVFPLKPWELCPSGRQSAHESLSVNPDCEQGVWPDYVCPFENSRRPHRAGSSAETNGGRSDASEGIRAVPRGRAGRQVRPPPPLHSPGNGKSAVGTGVAPTTFCPPEGLPSSRPRPSDRGTKTHKEGRAATWPH